MSHSIIKLLFICCIISFPYFANAQIFMGKNFHPGITTVKGNFFSGTGGKGYWSVEQLDTLGRTIENSSFKKKTLLSKTIYTYNSQNDVVSETVIYDINNPGTQTTHTYQYVYENNKIALQKETYHNKDSVIYQLIENKGDSIFTYKCSSYYLASKNPRLPITTTYIFTYRDNLLVKNEKMNEDGKHEITSMEYDPNGNLSHRLIERTPVSDTGVKQMYVGGPGSDDQYYSYIYDSAGRVKTKYTTVDGKRYKLAAYRYTK